MQGHTRPKHVAKPEAYPTRVWRSPHRPGRSHTCFERRLTRSTETVSGRLPVRQTGKCCSSPDTARTALWMLKIVCLSRLKFVGPGAGSQLHRESFSMIHRPPGCRGPILMQGRFGTRTKSTQKHSAPGVEQELVPVTFPGCFCQTLLCLRSAAQVDARCGPLQQSGDSPAVQ